MSSPTTSRSDPARVVTGWKKIAARVAGLIMRIWTYSLRVQASPTTRHMLAQDKQATLFAIWHNRLFIAAAIARGLRPDRPLHNLISASKDGAWLTAFFETMGLRAVRGSSSRGGREAAATLVDVLKSGHDVGITPDGPRGPIYGFKPGALVVARRSRSRLLLIGVHYSRACPLRSWDRFLVPHPFSEVFVVAETFPAADLDDEHALKQLEDRLRLINAVTPAGEDTPQGHGPAVV